MGLSPFDIIVRHQIYYKNINIGENNNGTTQYMKQQHQNNIFIDRKQCSFASSRGQPPADQLSITIILKTKTYHALDSYLY